MRRQEETLKIKDMVWWVHWDGAEKKKAPNKAAALPGLISIVCLYGGWGGVNCGWRGCWLYPPMGAGWWLDYWDIESHIILYPSSRPPPLLSQHAFLWRSMGTWVWPTFERTALKTRVHSEERRGKQKRGICKEEKRRQGNMRLRKSEKIKQSGTSLPKSHTLMIHNHPKSLTHPEPWLEHTLMASASLPCCSWASPLTNVCLHELALTASVCKWGRFRGSEKRVEVKPGLSRRTHQACSPLLTKLLLSHDSFLSSPSAICAGKREPSAPPAAPEQPPPTGNTEPRPSSSLLLLLFISSLSSLSLDFLLLFNLQKKPAFSVLLNADVM